MERGPGGEVSPLLGKKSPPQKKFTPPPLPKSGTGPLASALVYKNTRFSGSFHARTTLAVTHHRPRPRPRRRPRAAPPQPAHPPRFPGQRNARRPQPAQLRPQPAGPPLPDGRLRQTLNPEALLNVKIVDLSEAETRELLLCLDPLARLALTDADRTETLHRLFLPQSPLLAALFQTIGKAEYGLRSLLNTLHPKDSEIKSLATNDTWPAPTRLGELAKITQHT